MSLHLISLLAATMAMVTGSALAQQLDSAAVEISEVDVGVVKRQNIANEVRIAGSLTPIRRSTLTSRVSATVIDLPVKIGDVVKKGDLLVRFDTEALASAVAARRAEIDALDAQIALADAVLERSTTLGERGASSEATRLEAKANLLKLKAQLRIKQAEVADAERSLAYASMHAEFDGVVASRSVEEGQTVPLNTELMTIVDLTRMEVDAGVPTSRIPLVRPRQPVVLNVEGFAGRTFTGEVVRISPTAVAGSRSVRVFLAIENTEGLLRGGMFTTGILKVDEQSDVIALPVAAIRHDEDGSFVLRVESGVLHRVSVDLGLTWSDRNLVAVQGLGEGEMVVTSPLPDIVAGTRVVIEGH
ncbi:efflux RND transporter periplasmic adaptor subunit [Rhizobium sp. S152]|uniref:efflux RND transporter periplasmic adaptor subunit n=1 Tax=Rhizobium sp. S152 TaxID=3055038 RepID=UPI0025A991BB|nr:efflux RND transporter periplasmic adaptor subunit [Rhizobium sp. S152]MDM9624956.1 efflux RND transporter periplasmic adaptor subunit [Rhizobium sp. S152]